MDDSAFSDGSEPWLPIDPTAGGTNPDYQLLPSNRYPMNGPDLQFYSGGFGQPVPPFASAPSIPENLQFPPGFTGPSLHNGSSLYPANPQINQFHPSDFQLYQGPTPQPKMNYLPGGFPPLEFSAANLPRKSFPQNSFLQNSFPQTDFSQIGFPPSFPQNFQPMEPPPMGYPPMTVPPLGFPRVSFPCQMNPGAAANGPGFMPPFYPGSSLPPHIGAVGPHPTPTESCDWTPKTWEEELEEARKKYPPGVDPFIRGPKVDPRALHRPPGLQSAQPPESEKKLRWGHPAASGSKQAMKSKDSEASMIANPPEAESEEEESEDEDDIESEESEDEDESEDDSDENHERGKSNKGKGRADDEDFVKFLPPFPPEVQASMMKTYKKSFAKCQAESDAIVAAREAEKLKRFEKFNNPRRPLGSKERRRRVCLIPGESHEELMIHAFDENASPPEELITEKQKRRTGKGAIPPPPDPNFKPPWAQATEPPPRQPGRFVWPPKAAPQPPSDKTAKPVMPRVNMQNLQAQGGSQVKEEPSKKKPRKNAAKNATTEEANTQPKVIHPEPDLKKEGPMVGLWSGENQSDTVLTPHGKRSRQHEVNRDGNLFGDFFIPKTVFQRHEDFSRELDAPPED
ncbi:hypothetical protein H072_9995 [Dactylellina haptotyla CBS 200.50]|uniref:Uncharacterized protein n=1 Tax=Dactylellina haptotyla (strain CBS 200.50) TaxID=1284197 RepID=S8BMP6_DACHA|nr:hypothetical protein H072_9995 [Dactylellina haptotyla CBS 200.50]